MQKKRGGVSCEMIGFLKKILSDNYTKGQKIVFRNLSAQRDKVFNEVDAIRNQHEPHPYCECWFGYSMRMQELSEQFAYQDFFIRNNPHLIEDDGRIKPQIDKGNGLEYVSYNEYLNLTKTDKQLVEATDKKIQGESREGCLKY